MNIKQDKVEIWDVFEVELLCYKSFKNPFVDVTINAYFKIGDVTKKAEGFYDGGHSWKIRFMPQKTGVYTFKIESSLAEFQGLEGKFESIEPSLGNHGPVRVAKKYHFSYEDGTSFFVMGTTAYAWTYRPEEIRKETLVSFSKYGFNKVRMLVFPKCLAGMKEIDLSHEPPVLPFEGDKECFDFKRFNIEYFKNLDERIKDLLNLGIEADVILFHNYDLGMWEIDKRLNNEDGIFYVKYLIARIAAFRNVWWSLANEYDIVRNADGKGNSSGMGRRDWDSVGTYLMEHDPYNHLRSIHNWKQIYPNREWMTHVSIQNPNTYTLLLDIKKRYGKPVINDEYQYEGNLTYRWGNLTGEEELFRHWMSVMAGGYATHGECYVVNGNNRDIFWTYGGTMVGQSAPRLKLLKEIMDSLPYQEMEPDHSLADDRTKFCLKKEGSAYLYLITRDHKADNRRTMIGNKFANDKNRYEITVYDLWNCTIIKQEVKSAGLVAIMPYPVFVAVKAVKVQEP